MTNSLQGKRLLVVNACNPTKTFAFQKLRDLGIHIIVLHLYEASWIQDCVDERIISDVYDHDLSLSVVKRYASDHHIDGVLTFWEESVLLTAKISDILHLAGITHETASRIKNKHEFRKACEQYHLPSIMSHMIKSEIDLDWIVDNMNFPVVLKPCYGAASTHTIKIDKREDFISTYHYTVDDTIDQSVYLKDGKTFYVEEFLQSDNKYTQVDELDVDIVVQDNIVKYRNILDNQTGGAPYFTELSASTPSVLDDVTKKQIFDIVIHTIHTFGLQNAILHYEFKITPQGPIPLELNMRMGGGETYRLNLNAYGIDLVESAACVALGIPIICNKQEPDVYYMGGYILPPKSGIIKNIVMPKAIAYDPLVVYCNILKKVGDLIQIPPEGYDNFDLGSILVMGNNIDTAHKKLRETLASIVIEIKP